MSESGELTELEILERNVEVLEQTLAAVSSAEPTSTVTPLVVAAIKSAESSDSFLAKCIS